MWRHLTQNRALSTSLGLFAFLLPLVLPDTSSAAAERPHQCAADGDSFANFDVLDPLSDTTEVAFTGPGGNPVTLADYARQGRAVVLNFWATWCAPCVREMPHLDDLKAKVKGDGIDVLAVSGDRGGSRKVDPFFKKHGYKNLEQHFDLKGEFARALKVRGLPTTILIDADGKQRVRVRGAAEWNSPETVAYIRSCLTPNGESPA